MSKKQNKTTNGKNKKVNSKIMINSFMTPKIVIASILIVLSISFLVLFNIIKKDSDNIKEKVEKPVIETTTAPAQSNEDGNKNNYVKKPVAVQKMPEVTQTVIIPTVIDYETEKVKLVKESVLKAEKSLKKEDIVYAEDLIDNLTNSELKEELEQKLEEIVSNYNLVKLIETLEDLANNAKNKEDVLVAINYREENELIKKIEELINEILKEELINRMEKLSPILDDETLPVITGVVDGEIYNINVLIDVIEENVRTLTMNGNPYELEDTLLDDGEYIFEVVDMAYNSCKVTFVLDRTKPIITLIGDDIVYVEYKEEYKELGATYEDNIDGTGNIENPTNGVVDTNKVGTYLLEYEYIDSAGNSSVETRNVIVQDTILPTAIATAYYKDGKYLVKLTNISEEIIGSDSYQFETLPSEIIITDVNGNINAITIQNETNIPTIEEKLTNNSNYSKSYEFDIRDESNIEVVKIEKGSYAKEYFKENGEVLTEPYSYIIYENGDYTIYVRDMMGNENTKTITIDTVQIPNISDDELNNALLISDIILNDYENTIAYTKKVSINPLNDLEITELKIISTDQQYNDIIDDSFNSEQIHGSNVNTLSIQDFEVIDNQSITNDEYYYIYFKVKKGEGLNIDTASKVIEVKVAS